ncbi:MAG: hypothetical protein ACRCR9_05175 [Chitinophagaceae bacterium]
MNKKINTYQKWDNIIYELIASILLGIAIGYFIDKKIYGKLHLYIAIIPAFFIISVFVRLYIQVKKVNQNNNTP